MARWHHQCNGHELGQSLGDGEGQAGLACCSPWGQARDWVTEQKRQQRVKRSCRPLCLCHCFCNDSSYLKKGLCEGFRLWRGFVVTPWVTVPGFWRSLNIWLLVSTWLIERTEGLHSSVRKLRKQPRALTQSPETRPGAHSSFTAVLSHDFGETLTSLCESSRREWVWVHVWSFPVAAVRVT